MTQTITRELRLKFLPVLLKWYGDNPPSGEEEIEHAKSAAQELAEVALQVAGITKREAPQSLEWLIRGGASNEEIEKLLTKEKMTKEAIDTFEKVLVFNPLPWDSNAKWMRLKKFVAEEYRKDVSCFRHFKEAREGSGKYSLPANNKIYQDPDLLIAIWPSLFKTQEPREKEHLL